MFTFNRHINIGMIKSGNKDKFFPKLNTLQRNISFKTLKILIMKKLFLISFILILARLCPAQQSSFVLNSSEYFENGGVNVMVFQDFYPEGHQGGVGIIMHGKRMASNGDLRLDANLNGGMPISGKIDRKIDAAGNIITAKIIYPDPDKNKYSLLYLNGIIPFIYDSHNPSHGFIVPVSQ